MFVHVCSAPCSQTLVCSCFPDLHPQFFCFCFVLDALLPTINQLAGLYCAASVLQGPSICTMLPQCDPLCIICSTCAFGLVAALCVHCYLRPCVCVCQTYLYHTVYACFPYDMYFVCSVLLTHD